MISENPVEWIARGLVVRNKENKQIKDININCITMMRDGKPIEKLKEL